MIDGLTQLAYSTDQKRVSGVSSQVAPHAGPRSAPMWGLLLFAGPFLVAGILITLIGLEVIAVDPKNIHAPMWVITVAGLTFLFGGVLVVVMALKQQRAIQRRLIAGGQFGRELGDYAWQTRHMEDDRWGDAVKTLLMTFFMGVFLSIFNWWAIRDGGCFLWLFVGLFDLLLFYLIYKTAQLFLRALKFGASKVAWESFPVRPNGRGEIQLFWHVPTGISVVDRAHFTLRCIKESRVRGNDSTSIAQEEHYHETLGFEEPRRFSMGDRVQLDFLLPEDPVSTSLSTTPAWFYRLEVQLDLPGVDFESKYLVPVYL